VSIKIIRPVDFLSDGTRRSKPEPGQAKDVATQVALDALGASQQNTLDQLAVLRQTRGQRVVGSLKVPVHLQGSIMLDDSNVQKRTSRAGGDE
jgi:hypothetical protein